MLILKDNNKRFIKSIYAKFKFQYDNTLSFPAIISCSEFSSFKFQYDNTLRRSYKSHSDIILFLLSFVNLNLLLKNKKFKYF